MNLKDPPRVKELGASEGIYKPSEWGAKELPLLVSLRPLDPERNSSYSCSTRNCSFEHVLNIFLSKPLGASTFITYRCNAAGFFVQCTSSENSQCSMIRMNLCFREGHRCQLKSSGTTTAWRPLELKLP